MPSSTVQYKQHDGIATITLNRPEARNTITPQLCIELSEAVEEAAADNSVKVVVLRGAGEHFCAGADLKQPIGERVMPIEDMLLLGGRAAMQLHQMPKPTIAAVRGSVAGGGLALALACDLRVMDTSVKASFAYTRIGLSGDFGCLYFLTRLIGQSAATEFALTCPKLNSYQVRDWGLVREVAEPNQFVEAYTHLAQQLAGMSGAALARIKQNLMNSFVLNPEDYLKAEVDHFVQCRMSDDFKQVLGAFKKPADI